MFHTYECISVNSRSCFQECLTNEMYVNKNGYMQVSTTNGVTGNVSSMLYPTDSLLVVMLEFFYA